MVKDMERLERLESEYEEALFRLATHLAAEEEGQALEAECANLQKVEPITPGATSERRFLQQLNSKQKRERPWWRLPKGKMAAAILVATFLLLTAISGVDALRSKVLGLFAKVEDERVSFWLREESPGANISLDIRQAHIPTFLPPGFTLSHLEMNQLGRKTVYSHGEKHLEYWELADSKNISVDTAGAMAIEVVDISGTEGLLLEGEKTVTLVWSKEERMFLLQGTLDSETLLLIARSVEYVE